MTWPDELTRIEKESIEGFVASAADAGYLKGHVIDIGSGREPYREIVTSRGGTYTPHDSPSFPASMALKDTTAQGWGETFDAVLCTQVVQYVSPFDLSTFFFNLRGYLRRAEFIKTGALLPDCYLVMTYPTNWPEVQGADLHRYTKNGMERVLTAAGFSIEFHERRAEWDIGEGYSLAYGYGVIAKRL